MATWTDGAAYAPIERPDGFATPQAEPLSAGEPSPAITPGPIPPPHDFMRSAPSPPLEQIRTQPPRTRNPSQPFQVSAAILTAGSSFGPGIQRDPLTPFATGASLQPPEDELSPTGEPLPPPTGEPLPPPTGYPLPPPTGYPLPAPTPAQPTPTQRTLLWVAVVCFGLGFLIPSAAAWMVLIGGLFSLRTRPSSGALAFWAAGTGAALLLLSLVLSTEAVAELARFIALTFGAWGAAALTRKQPPGPGTVPPRPPGYR